MAVIDMDLLGLVELGKMHKGMYVCRQTDYLWNTQTLSPFDGTWKMP